jgi:hypothetical protein
MTSTTRLKVERILLNSSKTCHPRDSWFLFQEYTSNWDEINTSRLPLIIAWIRGVLFFVSGESILALFSTNTFTISKCPLWEAKWRGVNP